MRKYRTKHRTMHRAASNGTPYLASGRAYAGVRGHVITATIAVLADGLPRTAEEICAAALARGLVPAGTSRRYVYTALIEYIARAKGHDRKPLIVQDRDRRFRANHTPDPWPTPADFALPAPSAASLAALERARATSLAKDPDAFERAVCALFETLGFVATHVGGNAAPDGFLDAPLGPLSYRALLECKTGQSNVIVSQLNVAEAAKYREQYEADYCLLVGPGFAPRTTFASELQVHGVSAWTIDDLAAVVHAGFDPDRLRPLFVPGLAADIVEDAVWDAAHGEAKRIAAICEILESIAARQQRVALAAPAAEAPHLDVDAAMLILDEHFAAGNSPARCTRADVEAAFAWLTHPRIRRARWTDAQHQSIIVTTALLGRGSL